MATRRSLSDLHAARLQAVRLHGRGKNISEIARLTGLSRPTVSAALRQHALGGDAALKPTPRGRAPGQGRLLSPDRELHLRRLLFNHHPQELGIDADAWTRNAVLSLVAREFRYARTGLQPSMAPRTLGHYLSRWGLTGHVAAGLDIGPAGSTGLGQIRLLWELLGWYPQPTKQVTALAGALADSIFIARHLFDGLGRPWTFRRRLDELKAYTERFVNEAPKKPPRDQPSWLVSSKITFGLKQLIQATLDLASSARRRRLTDRAIAVSSMRDERHISIRIFHTKLVEISHGRSAARHVGMTSVRQEVRQGLFMGRVDLVSGDAAVDFVMDPTGADDAKDNVHVRLQRCMRPVKAS